MTTYSITALRADLYRLLDRVLETGMPIEVERNGRRLRIAPADSGARLAAAAATPGVPRGGSGGAGSPRLVGRVEPLIHLDTHVVAWLYALGASSLSERAVEAIEAAAEVRCSPMVRLELQYLHEIGRVRDTPVVVFDSLAAALGLRMCDEPFFAVAREAERQSWTRDPFDRIIVAHAELAGAPLVTKDATIHAAYARALW